MSDPISVRSLQKISVELLHRSANEAFSDYPVDVQMSLDEFVCMLRQNSVSLALSAGLFDGDRLVGFWVNGLRQVAGRTVAYDSGTAICKPYRGQGLSKRLAAESNRLLLEQGVQQYVLEVLVQNELAHDIYLKDGFVDQRRLLCFEADSPQFESITPPVDVRIEESPFVPDIVEHLPDTEYPLSWQNATASMIAVRQFVHAVLAYRGEQIVGYGLLFTSNDRVSQLGFTAQEWNSPVPSLVLQRLWRACSQSKIGMLNVEPGAEHTLALLERHGFELFIEQYEMSKELEPSSGRA